MKQTSNPRLRNSHRSTSRFNAFKLCNYLVYIVIFSLSYFYGYMKGRTSGEEEAAQVYAAKQKNEENRKNADEKCFSSTELNNLINEKVAEKLEMNTLKKIPNPSKDENRSGGLEVPSWIQTWSKVSKKDFLDTHDYGTPRDHSGDFGDVLLLYNSDPGKFEKGVHITAADATRSCKELNTVIVPSEPMTCTAILQGYPSYHLQRWMKDVKGRERNQLVHVGRGLQRNGMEKFAPPTGGQTVSHWKKLIPYLSNLDALVNDLKPKLTKIARDNTIVVAVVNLGQSSLLMNFVCNARSKGLDISNLFVFATDEETLRLCNAMGLSCYYDEVNFKELPTTEARHYGDRIFANMMWAKVIVVQVVNFMGFDVLFQDVDVVWHKDPIPLLKHGEEYQQFDMMFQDDGARSLRYAPYCANSGFYFIRYNDRTRFFFTNVLYSGDFIVKSSSHQQALTALLAEHSSLTGLRVKTLDTHEFPGGWNYHRRSNKTIKQMVGHPQGGNEKHIPTIFHMSWTANKDDKLKYLKQLGSWNLKEQCEEGTNGAKIMEDDGQSACCSIEPLVTCFYRDKPSIKPCKESKPIDKGGRSWW